MKPVALWTSLILILVLAAIAFLVRRFEGNLVFFPSPEWDVRLADFQPAEEVKFQSDEGLILSGAWLKAAPSRAVILYCHGNAGNLSHRISTADFWRREFGVSVFLFDYRGYGRSQGSPSEEGIFQDTLVAFQELRRLAPGQAVIVYGRSLGTVPAVRLALTEALSGLILDSPLSNAQDMAGRILPLPGMGWVTSFKLDNLEAASGLKTPLLVFHGERDSIIPLEQGKRVYEAASRPKKLVVLEGQGHNDNRTDSSFVGEFQKFLDGVTGGQCC